MSNGLKSRLRQRLLLPVILRLTAVLRHPSEVESTAKESPLTTLKTLNSFGPVRPLFRELAIDSFATELVASQYLLSCE